jgi:hypothetical protein
MSKAMEIITAYIELGASQEDLQDGDYAEKQINTYSNFQLISAMSEAIDWVNTLSDEEMQKRGWS